MRNSTVLRSWFGALGALTSVVTLLLSATAAAQEAANDDADPPERVARLSYIKGGVSFRSEGEEEWTDGSINRPLTTGDQLRLESQARAELQTGPLDVQLDERSDLSFLELTDDVAQIRLTSGAIYLNLRRLRADEVVEVDTPHAAIAISKPGEYSIVLVNEGVRTVVRAYSGECEVTDHRQTLTLRSREQASFAETDDAASQAVVEPAATRTAFDTWAHERALRIERSASTQYVAPDVIGSADLDEHGYWANEAEYGHVWYPSHVAVGWSPYRYGHWAWISPWGWTWVDDAPWGFAPFHYGRWAYVHSRWGWVPGPIHVRPVYAPALVAWVGTAPPRSSISFSIAFGTGIGWFPLAPREIYVPSYYCTPRHIHNVNYSNTVVVNNVHINRAYHNRSIHFDHRNRGVHDAITVVKPESFTGSRRVRDHMVRVDQRELRNWNTHNAIPEVKPNREHTSRGSHGSNIGMGAKNGGDRTHGREVVMRHTPRQPPGKNSNVNSSHVNRGMPSANRERRADRQPQGSATGRPLFEGSRNTWRGRDENSMPRGEPRQRSPHESPASMPPAREGHVNRRPETPQNDGKSDRQHGDRQPTDRQPIDRPSLHRPQSERTPIDRRNGERSNADVVRESPPRNFERQAERNHNRQNDYGLGSQQFGSQPRERGGGNYGGFSAPRSQPPQQQPQSQPHQEPRQQRHQEYSAPQQQSQPRHHEGGRSEGRGSGRDSEGRGSRGHERFR